jgi:hypothetical protein
MSFGRPYMVSRVWSTAELGNLERKFREGSKAVRSSKCGGFKAQCLKQQNPTLWPLAIEMDEIRRAGGSLVHWR